MENESNFFTKENLHNLTDFEDRAYGCVVGAFIGDSMGSFLEFSKNVPEDLADKALKMPGGGVFQLTSGQVTDDSEMALSMAAGILESLAKQKNFEDLNLDYIAKYYRRWRTSSPFDLGSTISGGISHLSSLTEPNITGWAQKCRDSADEVNQKSTSNGGLMRITPLAVYCSLIEDTEKVKQLVLNETHLTHSNPKPQHAAISYVLAIRHLITHEGNVEETLNLVEDYIKNEGNEITDFWEQLNSGERISGKHGGAKIAWNYSFECLKEKYGYLQSMKMIMMQAGDTDTNCAIAGGLLGASMGLKKLYQEAKDQVDIFYKCDVTGSEYQKRPEFFNPRNILKYIEKLILLQQSFNKK